MASITATLQCPSGKPRVLLFIYTPNIVFVIVCKTSVPKSLMGRKPLGTFSWGSKKATSTSDLGSAVTEPFRYTFM